MLDVFDATIVCGGKSFLEAREKRLLRLELLDDRLDDQIALREAFEVVLGIADLDQRGAVGGHERGGLRLLRALDAAARHRVPIGSGTRHVEKDHGHARGRGERRDPASHRSRPDHTEPANAHDLVLRRNCHVLEQYEGVKIRDDVARATVLNVLLDERLRRLSCLFGSDNSCRCSRVTEPSRLQSFE